MMSPSDEVPIVPERATATANVMSSGVMFALAPVALRPVVAVDGHILVTEVTCPEHHFIALLGRRL